jgi:hypothetical protein
MERSPSFLGMIRSLELPSDEAQATAQHGLIYSSLVSYAKVCFLEDCNLL